MHDAEMSTPSIALQSKKAGKVITPNNSNITNKQMQILAARNMPDAEMSTPSITLQSRKAEKLNTPNHFNFKIRQDIGSPEGNRPCKRGTAHMPTAPEAAWVALIAGTGCQLPA